MKRLSIFIIGLSFFATGCLKDDPNVDFSNLGTVIQMPYSGKGFFAQDALTDPTDTIVKTFTINIASPYPLNKDLSVTVGIDKSLVDEYNTYDPSVHYEAMPDSVFSFSETTVTIPAGSRLDTLTITFYKTKVPDPTKNYLLPIVLKDASGETISGNMSVHYYHFIGNPLAGSYNWDFSRWPNQDQSGDPDISWTDVTTLSPVTPTQFEAPSGYYTGTARYEVSFTNNGGTLSDFTVSLNADDVKDIFNANGITVVQTPKILTADPVNKVFQFQYIVFNGSAYRYIIDKYYK